MLRATMATSQKEPVGILGTATLVEFQVTKTFVLTKTHEGQTDGEVGARLFFIAIVQLGVETRQPIIDAIGSAKHGTGSDGTAVVDPIRVGDVVVEDHVMKRTVLGLDGRSCFTFE